MELALSQLVRDPASESQETAARALAPLVSPSERISAEVTKDGLLLRASSEVDLELAVDSLREVSRQLVPGKPQINYIQGDVWQEPYASLLVKIPPSCLVDVLGDLQARRAEIQGPESIDSAETVIRAVAPMSELFGYA